MSEKLTTIQFAVKWWADILDGSKEGRSYVSDLLDDGLEEIKDEHQDLYSMLSKLTTLLDDEYKKSKSEVQFTQEQRRRFEESLTNQIKKEFEKTGYCYLYTEQDARAGGTLGLATYYAGIHNEGNTEEEISPFPEATEMFITKDKVEIRYDENGPYLTIYDLSLTKLDDGKGGK